MSSWSGAAGKRVVITGATSGIGLAAAGQLAALGAKLTIIARGETKVRPVAGELGADYVIADLASKSAVRRAVEEILSRHDRIDVLVNNAGVYLTERRLTEDWIETTWAVNHLAPFLLTNLLLPRLKASAPARIVITASNAHFRAHVPFDDLDGAQAFAARSMRGPGYVRYAQTKLANVLFTAELARRLEGSGVTANCFHPGLVASGISRHQSGIARWTVKALDRFSRQPLQGAETLVWLVDSPEVSGSSGAYFVDKKEVAPAAAAGDRDAAQRLWDVSQLQTNCKPALAGQ